MVSSDGLFQRDQIEAEHEAKNDIIESRSERLVMKGGGQKLWATYEEI